MKDILIFIVLTTLLGLSLWGAFLLIEHILVNNTPKESAFLILLVYVSSKLWRVRRR